MFVPREEKVLYTACAGYIYKSITHQHSQKAASHKRPPPSLPLPPCEFHPDNLKIYAQKVWSRVKWIFWARSKTPPPLRFWWNHFISAAASKKITSAQHAQQSDKTSATKFVSRRETRNNFARRTPYPRESIVIHLYGARASESRRAYNSLAHKSLWK